MPSFDFDIDLDEFYEELSSREIRELIELMREDGYLSDEPSSSLPTSSGIEEIYLEESMNILYQNLHFLTVDEINQINTLAKKYK